MKKHYRKPRKIVRVLKRLGAWIVFIFTGKGPILKESVDEDLVDLSGQGRDKYGK